MFATSRPGRYWFVFSFTEDVTELAAELQDSQRELAALIANEATAPEEVTAAFEALSEITRRFIVGKSNPQTLVHELTIEGVVPDDPDPHDPKPKPLPDGRYKLAELSRLEAAKLADHTEAATVAGVYRAIAAQIQAGALKGQQRILDEVVRKLNERLGDGFANWKPWGLAVSGRLSDLYELDELKTDEDFSEAFGEIALGLEAL